MPLPTLERLTNATIEASRLRGEGVDVDAHLPDQLKGLASGPRIGLRRAQRVTDSKWPYKPSYNNRPAGGDYDAGAHRRAISFSYEAGPYKVKVSNFGATNGTIPSFRVSVKGEGERRIALEGETMDHHRAILDKLTDQAVQGMQQAYLTSPSRAKRNKRIDALRKKMDARHNRLHQKPSARDQADAISVAAQLRSEMNPASADPAPALSDLDTAAPSTATGSPQREPGGPGQRS